MKLSDRIENTRYLSGFMATILSTIIVLAATDGYTAGTHSVSRPASSEFGQGPRRSADGRQTSSTTAKIAPRGYSTVNVTTNYTYR